MNINPNYNHEEELPSAEEVMSKGMGFIAEKLIEPMSEKLSEEDMALIALIGLSFKIVAEQATAYEKIQEGLSESNGTDFNRN